MPNTCTNGPDRFIPTGVGKTDDQFPNFDPKSWFIPTGVGKTFDAGSVKRAGPVHPHGCGENVDI